MGNPLARDPRSSRQVQPPVFDSPLRSSHKPKNQIMEPFHLADIVMSIQRYKTPKENFLLVISPCDLACSAYGNSDFVFQQL
jgi:hypothetical protein